MTLSRPQLLLVMLASLVMGCAAVKPVPNRLSALAIIPKAETITLQWNNDWFKASDGDDEYMTGQECSSDLIAWQVCWLTNCAEINEVTLPKQSDKQFYRAFNL